MEIFGKSIKGRRKSNQDSIYFDFENDAYIMAVADGVGGNLGGDIASQLTTSICKSVFQQFSKNPQVQILKDVVASIYHAAQNEIEEMGKHDEKLKHMATTLTLVIGYKDAYVCGNIGDSRTYSINAQKVKQITKDHSYIQEYKDKYPETPIDPFVKTQLGHVITRSLNKNPEKMDVLPLTDPYFTLVENELLLLCSDGLQSDKFFDNLNQMISETDTLENFVNNIIEFAYDNGSRDNISAVVGRKKNILKLESQINED